MRESAGVIGYLSSFVSVALASIFNNAAGFFTLIMIKAAGFISDIPFAYVEVESFPAWLVWLWFGLLFVFARWLRVRVEPRESGLEWMNR